MLKIPPRIPLSSLMALWLISGGVLMAEAPKSKPSVAKGQKALAAPVKVTTVEGITEYQLANGLRVLLFPDPTNPTITFNVTYLVGSRNENYGETGMAHLLEHMVFKGTKKYTGENGTKTPVQILNELGAYFNGSTFYDRTNYFVTCPSTESNINQIVDLEVERMGNSLIREKDLWDKEKQRGEMTVVRNEYEAGENNPVGVLLNRTMAVAFNWHNYGKLVIGCKSDIENVNIKRLQDFYHKYYTPDNAVLLVAGKFDEAKLLTKINDTFGKLPKPTRVIEPTYTVEPVQDGERSLAVRRVGSTPAIILGYKMLASSDEQSASENVLAEVLGGSPSGRLYKALVETKKASFVFPIVFRTKEPGIALFGAVLAKDGNLEDVKSTMLQVVENVSKQPITQEEVDRAKAELLKRVDLTLNHSDQLGVELSESIAAGDWRLFFLDRDRTRAATPATVQAVADAFIKSSNRTIGEFIPTEKPDRAEIPPVKDVALMVKDYKGQAPIEKGEAFDASFKAIDARRMRSSTPAGLKVDIVPRKTRGGAVSLVMRLHFGDEQSLQGKALAGDLCAQMLMRGTAAHTRQQIKDALDRLNTQVEMYGSAERLDVRITTKKESLQEVMTLLAEVLRQPSFPNKEFETLVQEAVTGIQYSRSEPQSVAYKALRAHMMPYPAGHVRHVDTFDEELAALKAMKIEDVKAFYTDFYGAKGEVGIVGDVDPKQVSDQLNRLLGDWKAVKAYQRIPRKIFNVAPLQQSLETPDKANAIFLGSLEYPLRDDDPDYPALLLGDYLLGGGAIHSRLADRIRQQEGLSYGVGSYPQVSSEDRVGSWNVYAIYNPANAAKLEKAFQEELARALKDGFTEKEIQDARLSWKQSQDIGRSQEGSLAEQLANQLSVDRTMTYDEDLDRKVATLTSDQIVAALRKYIDPAKLSIIKAGDFAKAAKDAEKK